MILFLIVKYWEGYVFGLMLKLRLPLASRFDILRFFFKPIPKRAKLRLSFFKTMTSLFSNFAQSELPMSSTATPPGNGEFSGIAATLQIKNWRIKRRYPLMSSLWRRLQLSRPHLKALFQVFHLQLFRLNYE